MAFGGLHGGFDDFGSGVGPFVEQDAATVAQGTGEEDDGAIQGRHGARGDQFGAMGFEPGFYPLRAHFDVGEGELLRGGFDKTRLFLSGFEQGKARLRKNQRQRDAWETGAASGVDDMRGTREQAPRDHGIGDVFDGGLARAHDAREVEVLVRLHDEVEMAGRARDAGIAMGQVGRQDLVQFFGERHGAFMIAPAEVSDVALTGVS